MPASEISGKIQTVLGPIEPEKLGITMPHEHILSDSSIWCTELITATDRYLAQQQVSIQNLGWVHMNYTKNLDNLQLLDEDTAIKELLIYKRNGGKTVVDVTPKDTGRDPLGLARIARATGLNVIMGTAYYFASAHPQKMNEWTEEQIATQFINEIVTGVGDTGVHAGIIGEIGCTSPLHKNEMKVLRAAAIAQQKTGATIMIHPGHDEEAPSEIIGILKEAGADLKRTIMCHINRTLLNPENRLNLANEGCYLEWDGFGRDALHFPSASRDWSNDTQSVDQILELISEGYERQILVSQDVFLKCTLTCYGGHGYSYIITYGLQLMRRKGLSEHQIRTILIDNPKNALQFTQPK